MLHIKCFVFNEFGERCTVAWNDSLEAVIVDPGCRTPQERDALTGFIRSQGLRPVRIVLTHAHFDHIYGVAYLSRIYGICTSLNAKDRVILENNGVFCSRFGMPLPEEFATEDLREGDVITFGSGENVSRWEVLETPGHTPGGVCLLDRQERILFSGDTLFAGSIGRTDNPWGDYDALMEGIFGKLMTLDGDITVIPGHGDQTTIADERMKNPFLQPFNEPFEEDA